ncbi:MAG: ORF6N domain-containing protein [Candidatus Paceibacterota bacterium]|jgi:hypothetical protein
MSETQTDLIPIESISQRIFIIRGFKVMIDADIAELYQVTTKVLNQAVSRNLERFPSDFIFKLSQIEKDKVVTNCDHLAKLRFSHQLPFAFTEHGVAMLSAVLKSDRAVQMSVFIVRAFIKLREMLTLNKELALKIEQLETRQDKQGQHIAAISNIIKKLIDEPVKPKGPIGFSRD